MNSDIQEWPPPSDPTVFESLCLDLWKDIWQDVSAQKNGRRGQNQDGVDIFGQSNEKWIGVQCKQKDGLLRTNVTPAELEEEVNAAYKFRPALHRFILATTGRRDAKVQERARILTDQNKSKGLFSVEFCSWGEIWLELCRRPELLKRVGQQFWPHFFKNPLSRPHQLLPLPKLYGRDEEFNKIEKQSIDSEKWAGFQGMSGVGKTAFATAFAHRLKNRYPDAQIFFDLRGADLEKRPPAKVEEVMRFVISSFNPAAIFPDSVDELAALYRSVLDSAGQVLLFFDNAADAEQLCLLLPPPNCFLIITSRKFLNVAGLKMHKIGCLSPNYSQELLINISPRISGFEKHASELCGYLPLALVVVAGIFNQHTICEPAQVLDDLRMRRKRLAPVDAAFQASFDRLGENVQKRWCQLSVFSSSFDLSASSAVWGILCCQPDNNGMVKVNANNLTDTQDKMQTLVNANLVEWNSSTHRFRLHNLIRHFCANKLSNQESTEARYCLAAYYCNILQQASDLYKKGGNDSVRGIALFDLELGHIAQGHGWAMDSFRSAGFQKSFPNLAKSVAVACSAYPCIGAALFSLRLSPQVRIAIGDAGLRAAREIRDRMAEGSHLGNIGVGHVQTGNIYKAISFFKERFVIAKELNDFEGQCNAMGNLAESYSTIKQFDVARNYCEQELELRRTLGDRLGEGVALCNLGSIFAANGRHDLAVKLFLDQLQISRDFKSLRNEAITLIYLGGSYRILGRTDEAICSLEQALTICRQLRDVKSEGGALSNLANVYAWIEEPEKAIEVYKQALTCKQVVGDIMGVAQTLDKMGRAYLQLHDHPNSLIYAQEALRIYEQIHHEDTRRMKDIVLKLRKIADADGPSQQIDKNTIVTGVYYYSFHVLMQDLRGGFPGFLSDFKPEMVDGMVHLLVACKSKYSEDHIKTLISNLGGKTTVYEQHASRPFSPRECAALPVKLKQQLENGGYCLTGVPYFSSGIKPFRDNP